MAPVGHGMDCVANVTSAICQLTELENPFVLYDRDIHTYYVNEYCEDAYCTACEIPNNWNLFRWTICVMKSLMSDFRFVAKGVLNVGMNDQMVQLIERQNLVKC